MIVDGIMKDAFTSYTTSGYDKYQWYTNYIYSWLYSSTSTFPYFLLVDNILKIQDILFWKTKPIYYKLKHNKSHCPPFILVPSVDGVDGVVAGVSAGCKIVVVPAPLPLKYE